LKTSSPSSKASLADTPANQQEAKTQATMRNKVYNKNAKETNMITAQKL